LCAQFLVSPLAAPALVNLERRSVGSEGLPACWGPDIQLLARRRQIGARRMGPARAQRRSHFSGKRQLIQPVPRGARRQDARPQAAAGTSKPAGTKPLCRHRADLPDGARAPRAASSPGNGETAPR
jgi:hypothetical protein